MKIQCTQSFASELYVALLYAEKRLTTEAEGYYMTGETDASTVTYRVRDQICVVSEEIRAVIEEARRSGPSVSLSLQLTVSPIRTPL